MYHLCFRQLSVMQKSRIHTRRNDELPSIQSLWPNVWCVLQITKGALDPSKDPTHCGPGIFHVVFLRLALTGLFQA